jgi:hypothetical protein
MDIEGFVRFFDDISYFRPSETVDVPAQAAFGAAQAIGYTFGMAMISWRLAVSYVIAALAGGIAIMLWPAGIGGLILPLSDAVVAMGPGALGPDFYGGQIVLASLVTGTVALAGALGILVWALALRDREPLLAD